MDWAPCTRLSQHAGAKARLSVPFSGSAQRTAASTRDWMLPVLPRTLLLFGGFSALSDSLLMRLNANPNQSLSSHLL